MGTRAQVLMKDTGVYLYQHWDGDGLYDRVVDALRKKWRWDDPEYLGRIIFDEMTRDEHGEETGYGIGAEKHWDIEYLVVVDCERQEITHLKCTGGDSADLELAVVSFGDAIDGKGGELDGISQD